MNLKGFKNFVIRAMDEHDWDRFHDVLFEATGKSLDNLDMVSILYKLPENILAEMLTNGLDTCTCDRIFEHVRYRE